MFTLCDNRPPFQDGEVILTEELIRKLVDAELVSFYDPAFCYVFTGKLELLGGWSYLKKVYGIDVKMPAED